MKRIRWQLILGLALGATSALLYGLQYALYGGARDVLYWLFSNLAFLPIQVLFVSLILTNWLGEREKRSRLEKLNMVVGAYFSEVGTALIRHLAGADPHLERIRNELLVSAEWRGATFEAVNRQLRGYDYRIEIARVDLESLRGFLVARRAFLLGLLESPTLLEHETFTELLRAVFHLTEELEQRPDMTHLPDADRVHLAYDMKRAYTLIIHRWLDYMRYLKDNYPYLFSLAMRTNPFDERASAVVLSESAMRDA
jgi:hypothetical protein